MSRLVENGERMLIECPLSAITKTRDMSKFCWAECDTPITLMEIHTAFAHGDFEYDSYQASDKVWTKQTHINRIAYLAWCKLYDTFPISVEFLETGYRKDTSAVVINDGHHRLYAAIFNQEETITVECGGFIRSMELYFDLKIPESDFNNENFC